MGSRCRCNLFSIRLRDMINEALALLHATAQSRTRVPKAKCSFEYGSTTSFSFTVPLLFGAYPKRPLPTHTPGVDDAAVDVEEHLIPAGQSRHPAYPAARRRRYLCQGWDRLVLATAAMEAKLSGASVIVGGLAFQLGKRMNARVKAKQQLLPGVS